jgi:hypothetical protein
MRFGLYNVENFKATRYLLENVLLSNHNLMFPENRVNFVDFIGHQTLLYGETNTGKTSLTAKFVDFLLTSKKGDPSTITILDFAPPLNKVNDIKFGGTIKDFSKLSLGCRYIPLENKIIPPRFNARNKDQLFEYLCHNYLISSRALEFFKENPTKFLIVNDLSIYLHLGTAKYLLRIINLAETFFGNAYYGAKINTDFSKLLSIKERKRVEYLIKHVETAISTPNIVKS